MKRVISAITILVSMVWGFSAMAQTTYWVQIEANATLTEAQDSARRYGADLDNVAAFRLGASGWYATVVGPFDQDAASDTLIGLLRSGAVPRDSYVSDGGAYGQQVWPIGANTLNAPAVEAPGEETLVEEPVAETPVTEPPVEPEVVAEPEPVVVPEETRQEALNSERNIDREGREALQVALQFEGFYNSAIDGAFGPGTRGSMAAWQASRGYEETGVLTTRQRAELLGDYRNMIDSLGLASVIDEDAGIEVIMPTAMVKFDRYEAPFAHYTGDNGVRVVLISQSGGQSTLYGLYDILQSLEVVPAMGERTRGNVDFTINGEDSTITSYTYAKVVDGAVKGYMLVWPKGGDARQFSMVLDAMKDSFSSTGAAVLDDNAGLDEAMQSVDLVSGLEIRRADRARTGFYVDAQGTVLTTAEAVAGCSQITLDESYPASVVSTSDALGAAIVKPNQELAPVATASFLTGEARIKADLAVAGYSFGGRLSSATLTFGSLADVKGLEGENDVYRLDLAAQDGDAGGPVISKGGAVLGMLQSASGGNRQFPPEVSFAAKSAGLVAFLSENGVTPAAMDSASDLSPHALAVKAADMSVLVSCWE